MHLGSLASPYSIMQALSLSLSLESHALSFRLHSSNTIISSSSSYCLNHGCVFCKFPSPTHRPRTLHLRLRPNLKPLTSRVVELTRRRQLRQIFEEIETAKRRYGKLNVIVMNAVIEACIHCGNFELALKVFDDMAQPENCGVDDVTYGTLLKGFGKARRIDEAFQLLESIEQGSAVGSPRMSAALIYGLLNALIESGDLRRANGLLARYGAVLHEGGTPSISMYNLLMKGYIGKGFPQKALALHDVMLCRRLKPDKLTYNTMISACVKIENLDDAMRYFREMKVKAQMAGNVDLSPDVVTYTTLIKGFGQSKNLSALQKVVMELKLDHELHIDRIAYTSLVDALLNCGAIKGALCIYGEILKIVGQHPELRPKPHLYLSLMRAIAVKGDYNLVRTLHNRMWPDSAGTISPAIQKEADHLLMEAALYSGQVDAAEKHLTKIIEKWKGITWTNRGGMVAVQIQALLGFTRSTFSPYLLPQVSLDDPIESIMIPFEEALPAQDSMRLNKIVLRFFRNPVVPIVDEWGNCVGLVHREDCNELTASLATVMRSPPPLVAASTSISHVIDLFLEKRYKMVVIVKFGGFYSSSYSSSSRPLGVFSAEQLFKLGVPAL